MKKSEIKEIEEQIKSQSLKLKFKWGLEKSFHFIISPLTAFLKALISRREDDEDGILIVARILRIGDIITTQPAVKEIRRQFPDSKIDILVDAPLTELSRDILDVDTVIGFDKGKPLHRLINFSWDMRRRGYSRAYVFVTDFLSILLPLIMSIPESISYNFNMRGHPSSKPITPPVMINRPGFLYPPDYKTLHITQIWSNLVSRTSTPIKPEIKDPSDIERIEEVKSLKRFVVVHPSTSENSYLWMVDRWIEIISRISSVGYDVVLTGGKEDMMITSEVSRHFNEGVVNLAGKTDLFQFISVVSDADVVVTLDTSTGHLAGSIGTPVIVLFGPGDESIWRPLGEDITVIRGDSPCSVCKKSKCFQNRHYCMASIGVDNLWRAIKPHLH